MTNLLPTPTGIFFDWDNTLVDTWPVIHAALNELMRAMDKEEWSLEKVQMNVKRSMRESFPEMFGDRVEEASQLYQSAYRRIHLDNLQSLEGALKMLNHLKTLNIPVGVVSNKRGDTLRKESEHLGWDHYFDTLIGAGDAARDKPHADPLTLALKETSLAASPAIWFVGDTTVDLDCAQATGVTALLYGDVEAENGIYQGAPFHHHVKTHDELISLLT